MRLSPRERKIKPRAKELVVQEEQVNRSLELRQALEFVQEGDRKLLDKYIIDNLDQASYWYALGARRLLFGDIALGQSFDQATLETMAQASERAARSIRRSLEDEAFVSRDLVRLQRGYTQLMEGDPERLVAVRLDAQPVLTREWTTLVEMAWKKTDTYLGYLHMLVAADPGKAQVVLRDPRALELAITQLEEKRRKLSEIRNQGISGDGILDQIAFTLYEMRVLFPEVDLRVPEDERVALIQRLNKLRQDSKRFLQEQFPRVLSELAVAFAPAIQVDHRGIHVPDTRSMGKSHELPTRLAI